MDCSAEDQAWTLGAALLLFGSGVLACLAWKSGLYANTILALLAGLWITGLMLRQQARMQTIREAVIPPPAADASASETERRRLQSLLDQTPAPLVTLAADEVLRAANRAARMLFGTDDRITQAPTALREAIGCTRPGERTTVRLPMRSGGLEPDRPYALSVASSTGPLGTLRLAVLTDIQAELNAAEAATLRDLLGVLSHEIMNSLTPVTSLAESAHALLAEGGTADVQRAAEALETIGRRARGLDRFVQGYRSLARLPSPVLRPISVAVLLRDAASLFETRWRSCGVALELELPSPDILIQVDADLLIQALLNLLTNGAEAALIGLATQPRVALSGYAVRDGVMLRVMDNGDGIVPGQEEAIFRPFFTRKTGGTGIGLGIARQIAMSHGGTLILEAAAPGPGAAFLLCL